MMRMMWAVVLMLISGGVAHASSLWADASALPIPKATRILGQRIIYYEAGSGPTLVLVHGFASQASFDWGQVMAPLAKNYHVIALDQIGFGASDKPAIDYSVQTFVDFLGEFLRTFGVAHFTLAGESLGGWIAAAYTIQALGPANHGPYALPAPERLILEDAAGHSPLPAGMRVAGSLADVSGIAIVFHDKSLITPEFLREAWTKKMAANDGQTQRLLVNNPRVASETVGGKLGGITVPTLVVWGADDELVPLADGRDYAEKIPGAKLVVIPACGHAPSIEKPQEFLDAINAFLK